jgi:DNA polymerase I-like protein with 3'-5' exonuclease and polymerase domains
MVAQTISLPNLRRFFIPDYGYYICEVDLAGADAQVVAWDAGDEDLKGAFKAGVKIHLKNARDMFPDVVRGWSDEAIKATDKPGGIYYNNKRFIHGTHYLGGVSTISLATGWTRNEVDRCQKRWFGLHPTIPRWHARIDAELAKSRTATNAFGYRIRYFDRVERLLPEACAWIAQSTVALICRKGMKQLFRNHKWVHLLLQNHDACTFQIPMKRVTDLPLIKQSLSITVPYPDPLTIPWGLTMSSESWGAAKERKW